MTGWPASTHSPDGEEIDALVHLAGIFVADDLEPESRDIYDRTMQAKRDERIGPGRRGAAAYAGWRSIVFNLVVGI